MRPVLGSKEYYILAFKENKEKWCEIYSEENFINVVNMAIECQNNEFGFIDLSNDISSLLNIYQLSFS